MELEYIRKGLEKTLSEKRYRHVLGVEEVCDDLAVIYGCDTLKARTAGLLHDCARHLSDEELISECRKFNLHITEAEMKAPYLLHAKVGAAYAKEFYKVTDENILNAIISHATGKPGMSKLEKIVYVADFIEPYRKPIPHLDKARKIAYNDDLDKAVMFISGRILEYLKSINTFIDPLTQETYNYYVYLRQSDEV
ncbi:MAG TPA: bis(5'-nucleosyl)-tetraphosphatase (symmetrical) YqeK [Mobilitalea sp.]|nr:bis(5'-nucleosyl)-tetraphosphatase (symmetrical) YqeK [Mobilitalea sp.]